MTASRAPWIVVALALATGGLWWIARPPPRPAPSNVVLIVVDTLRADHLGAWGHERPTSPHIDALARSGIRYAQATSQAPWTSPSIGSLMTGQYPGTLGIRRDNTILPQQATTLAESLSAAGLRTAAMVSHSFCGSDWQFDQGFEAFDESNVLGHLGVSSAGVTEGALAFLEDAADGPFFLWLHYFDPHYAYQLHLDHDVVGPSPYDGPVRPGMPISELKGMAADLNETDVDALHRFYDSEIAFTDHHIGRVLDRLEALGLTEDTLVVFTADHGEAFLDHGRIGHATTLYQELLHVPLIVRCPGWGAATVDDPVGNIGIFATVMACLGLPQPEDLAAGPLPPAGRPPDLVFSQTSKGGEQAMIRVGDHKVIASRLKKRPRFALYDLATDPTEQNDLASQGSATLAEMSGQLTELYQQIDRGAMPPETIDIDGWLKANLEALGYVEDD